MTRKSFTWLKWGVLTLGLWQTACSHDKPQIVNEGLVQSHRDLWQQEIGVGSFQDASWNRFGFYDGGGAFEHQYGGSKSGYFEYPLVGPDLALGQITIQSRLSAESNDKGKPEEKSDVTLKINGVEIGTQTVIPDDQKGRVYTWKVQDPALIQKIQLKPGEKNVLRFEVKSSAAHRNGLCLYGESLDGAEEGTPILVKMTPR